MSDYIRREAALEAFENADADVREDYRYGACDWGFGMKNIQKVLNSVPTADVEPVRRGRWISWEKADNCVPSPDRHECSVCHDAAQVLANGLELLSFYCPNCGAKMELEDENGT